MCPVSPKGAVLSGGLFRMVRMAERLPIGSVPKKNRAPAVCANVIYVRSLYSTPFFQAFNAERAMPKPFESSVLPPSRVSARV